MNRARDYAARLTILIAVVISMAGCAASQRSAARHSAEEPPAREQYVIQPNDLLLVTFAGEPDYNQQVRVDWRGYIDLPALTTEKAAEIQAAGLTPAELAARITEFGRKGKILETQRAQVFVSEYASTSFVVLGQVTQPGRFVFPRGLAPRMELAEAIAMAGGYTRLARQSRIVVKRGEKTYTVDLRKVAATPGGEHFTIIPNDVITVPERIF
jgi:polysaccharide export outer membrane protein